jgi:uncharacterized protein
MSFSIYDATVPVYRHLLTALTATLDKAAAHAAAKKVDPAVLITARLYPDMWSTGEQVKATCSHAVRGTSRLAGVPIPTFDGADATFDDLKARIAWVQAHLAGLDAAKFAGVEERTIVFPSGDTERRMSGPDYLLTFSLPNFYFHLSLVYAILRHNGVPLNKDDFIG